MATKLGLYNNALIAMGERQLVDTGDQVETARVITTVYDEVLADCLQEADWNFAMETCKLDADTGVTPSFGYSEVFGKPEDWVKTSQISADEYFSTPLLSYYDDAEVFFSADITPIYIRYVSNDTGLGNDLTKWPARYRRYVELEIASRVSERLSKGDTDALENKRDKAWKNAKAKDAMNDPQPKFSPEGSWSVARRGRQHSRDRGKRNTLIG